MRVAMDANALMMPVEAGVRVFDELDRILASGERSSPGNPSGDEPRGYDAVVPETVRAELEKLGAGGGEEATAASVAADLADRCETVDTEESYADDALYALAVDGDADAVVTNDGPLRERLLDAGVPVIHLRGRNQMTITRP
ncbi:twitching motility protein PilT [Halobacterium noricense]|uniref:twitching motility protein PilT n=1 Tax=Halobacterium noricense TaxID=223182 RepID=UPI001E35EB71|nr:twitching motility protein PilT [Halobacterium noricense]UHH24996.1 twitching motility protein PilT [Halobacterium noricense]